MNTKIFTATVLGALLLGGCSLPNDFDDFDDQDALDEPSAEPGASPIPGLADELTGGSAPTVPVSAGTPIIDPECIGAPVVGILDTADASCELREPLADWEWVEMFSTGSPDVAGLSLPVPDELKRFCMYEYVGPSQLLDDGQYSVILQAIEEHPDISLDTVAVDCMGFREQGDLNDATVVDALRESFMLNIDRPEDAELAPTEAWRQFTKLFMIDSVSQYAIDNGLAPYNNHGVQMASLARDISCTPGTPDCDVQVENLLAMPREDFVLPDWTLGEKYGSKIDMAVQIYAAVQKYRENKLYGVEEANRAIINLALGYQRHNLGSDDEQRGPHKALETALKFAACHGVPVFAASGNVSDEDCPGNEQGPLAPAYFNDMDAPTQFECEELGFNPDWNQEFPVFEPGYATRPLVFGVYGVDPYDNDLPNTREGSRAPLAALGFAGVAAGQDTPLTGSSVAVTAVSATAHMLWSYHPTMTPGELYDALYASGYPLAKNADYGGNGGQVHRLSVGAALDAACAGEDPNTCPQLGTVAAPPAVDGNLGGFMSASRSILLDPYTNVETFVGTTDLPTCENPLATELVLPQPEVPVCANCSVHVSVSTNVPDDDELWVSIDTEYKDMIADMHLLVEDTAGNVQSISFDPDAIVAINSYEIEVVILKFDAPYAASATVDFTLTTPGVSQSNPVGIEYY